MNKLFSLLFFIIIFWVGLSITLMAALPNFYLEDGSVNWWTSLWVLIVSFLISYLLDLIIVYILFMGGYICI